MLQSCQVSTRPSPHRVLTCRSRGEWNAWRVTCENFWPRCCCEYFLYVTHPPASTTCPQSAHSPSSEMFTGFSNYPECSFIYLFIYLILKYKHYWLDRHYVSEINHFTEEHSVASAVMSTQYGQSLQYPGLVCHLLNTSQILASNPAVSHISVCLL